MADEFYRNRLAGEDDYRPGSKQQRMIGVENPVYDPAKRAAEWPLSQEFGTMPKYMPQPTGEMGSEWGQNWLAGDKPPPRQPSFLDFLNEFLLRRKPQL